MRFLTFLLFLVAQFSISQNYSVAEIPKEMLENADAVGRLDRMDIHIESIDKMTYSVKQVVTVLNKSGSEYAATRVMYDDERKIKKIEATFFDAFGNELEVAKRRDFKDVAAVDGFSLYLDNRVLYYKYVPTQYPYTVEFTYEIETSDTGFFPPWYFLSGYGISVQQSEYSIVYPSIEFKPIVKEKNLENVQVEKTDIAGSLQYSATNIPAMEAESLSPSFSLLAPSLSIRLPKFHYKGYQAVVNDWHEMGIWIQEELLAGRDVLEENTVKEIQQLVKGIDNDLEKAKIIYNYVQDNTRYISVQIGIGGIQPISAIEVDKVKYGDCKGLTNYTKALLKAVGVESFYAVVESGSAKIDFEEDFADLVQGDHVILAIPYQGQYYWVDCTSQILPFGFIGDFTDGRKVLVVKPDGGEIMTTTSYLNQQNKQSIKARYRVLENLSMKGEVTLKTTGIQYDGRFSLEKGSREDNTEYYKNFWDNINGLDILDFKFDNDKENVVFTENVKLSALNYLSKNGNDYLLTLNAFNNGLYVPPRYRDRKMPFVVQRGFLDEDETIIEIPDNFHFTALPEKMVQETIFGAYKTEVIKKSEKQLLFKRSLQLNAGEYPKESYQDFRAFMRAIAKNDNQKIILKNDSQN
ncbi:DUF3857 domain-containing protein [Flagellimonas beolgyonensis]|uniref:DUF3857 domain-containing protein n=1 Tax=Flagellimonas beolgyonensis TaxID=864064 RepID=UPI000F8D8FC4|nr:DUF3857 domain-containing protein [Allomuricauda beolgyonensis]